MGIGVEGRGSLGSFNMSFKNAENRYSSSWQQKCPLWCFTQYSAAWVEGGNKKGLFGDSPSTVSPEPQ